MNLIRALMCFIIAVTSASAVWAQYLDDGSAGERIRKENVDTDTDIQPRCLLGIDAGTDVREGFASVAAAFPIGLQLTRHGLSADPTLRYMSMRSPRHGLRSLDRVIGTDANAKGFEFAIPLMYSYQFIDIDVYPYSPFLAAGAGYSFRRFAASVSTLLGGSGRHASLHSLTLHAGFGFVVRVNAQARLRVVMNAVPYFNAGRGKFSYDTTGGSIQIGMMTFVK